MPDIYLDVDSALSEVPVNVFPLTDDTDFKTVEDAVAYNAAGMDLRWNFVTSAGAYTSTAVTPTTAGNYDWTHQGDGMYSIEIPASGGASINNDTEGYGWFSGKATGVLPWRGPIIGFRAAGINDLLCDSAYSTTRGMAGTALPNAAADAAGGLPISDAGGLDLDARLDAAVSSRLAPTTAGRTLDVAATGEAGLDFDNIKQATGATTLTNITVPIVTTLTGHTAQTGDSYAIVNSGTHGNAALKTLIDAVDTVVDSILVDTAEIGAAGAGLTNINLPNQTMDIVGNITGNLSGSVGSVAGSVGSVATGGITRASLADDTGLKGYTGTAQAGGTNTITLDTGASATSSIYRSRAIKIVSGTGAEQVRTITAYNGTTKVATVNRLWNTQPDNTSVFVVLNTGPADMVATWGVGGDDGYGPSGLNAMASEYNDTGGISSVIISANGDVITAASLAADAIAEIQSGLATSAAQATAQSDLDILTGTDGVTLATSQPNYAPATSAQAVAIQGATFDTATDSLEAIRNRGDAAWTTLDAAGVRTAVGLASANLDTQLADLPTVAEFEARTIVAADYFVVGDYTEPPSAAAISTQVNSDLGTGSALTALATQTSVNTVAGYLDTEVAAIKAKTDNLPSDPADQSAVEAAILAAWTTALTESYNADGSAPTPAQALFLIMQRLTEFAISGTTVTIKKLDGSTTAATLTLDDASTPTSSTRAS